jgi:hypothetical protein
MTDTDERVTRLLGELATRADGHPTPDRVHRVRSRARRAAVVRTAGVVGLAAAVALVGGVRGVPLLRGDRSGPTKPASVVVAPLGLQVDLRQDFELARSLPRPVPGTTNGAHAVVIVHVHGLVPPRQVTDRSPSGREHLFGLRISGGGGSQGSVDDGHPPCAPAGAPAAAVDDQFPVTLTFEKAGTYTVTYETRACPPIGTVRQTLVVRAE